MRVRIFRPDGAPRRAALLVSGVHPDGIKEPRLVALARELAATGVIVVTPEIEDLINYRLTARVTDTIEDAAIWMVKRPDLFGHGADRADRRQLRRRAFDRRCRPANAARSPGLRTVVRRTRQSPASAQVPLHRDRAGSRQRVARAEAAARLRARSRGASGGRAHCSRGTGRRHCGTRSKRSFRHPL